MYTHHNLTDNIYDYNCYQLSTSSGGRGVTVWGPIEPVTLTHKIGDTVCYLRIRFIGTHPGYYSDKDNCLLTYTIYTNTTLSREIVPLTRTINGSSPLNVFLSKVAGHYSTITEDLAPMSNYNDTGENIVIIANNDPDADITIDRVQVVRAYQMAALNTSCSTDSSLTGDQFATRYDNPCNYDTCGGASYTGYTGDNHYQNNTNGTILYAGTDYTWNWTIPDQPESFHNYTDRYHCLFNLNNVCLCDDNGTSNDTYPVALTEDIPFQIKINDSNWKTFYHPKNNVHMGHSVDLATDSDLGPFYHDSPGTSNTLHLKIPTSSGVNFLLVDGDGEDKGIVNLYRYYKTKSCCATITSSTPGDGRIFPTPGPYTIPCQGTTFNMSANGGYYLSNITVDGTSKGTSNPYTVHMGDLNPSLGMEGHTINATFSAQQCTVTFSNDGHGSTSPSGFPNYYTYGTVVNIYAYPNTGYHFDHWSATSGITIGNIYAQDTTATVCATGGVVAYFAVNQFTLTTGVSSGSGSVSPATASYNYGTVVTMYPYPSSGWHLDHWMINDSPNYDTNPQITMTRDSTCYAVFAEDATSIEVQVYGTSGQGYNYQYSYYISVTLNSNNYLGFYDGAYYSSYDSADGSNHYANPDWYWIGDSSTYLQVAYWYM